MLRVIFLFLVIDMYFQSAYAGEFISASVYHVSVSQERFLNKQVLISGYLERTGYSNSNETLFMLYPTKDDALIRNLAAGIFVTSLGNAGAVDISRCVAEFVKLFGEYRYNSVLEINYLQVSRASTIPTGENAASTPPSVCGVDK